MTRKEMRLTAALLQMASDEFGNHCCNDMDDSLFRQFTTEEKLALAVEFHRWNGDLDEIMQDEGEVTINWFNRIGDSTWMSFMAHKLEEEAKGNQGEGK